MPVGGSGTARPSTVKIPGAFSASDPGIQINIYQNLSGYQSKWQTTMVDAARSNSLQFLDPVLTATLLLLHALVLQSPPQLGTLVRSPRRTQHTFPPSTTAQEAAPLHPPPLQDRTRRIHHPPLLNPPAVPHRPSGASVEVLAGADPPLVFLPTPARPTTITTINATECWADAF